MPPGTGQARVRTPPGWSGGCRPRSRAAGRADGFDVVITNAVRYASRADAATVDILDSVRRLVPLDPRHLDRSNAEGYLKSGKEMADVADEICRLAGLRPARVRPAARADQIGRGPVRGRPAR